MRNDLTWIIILVVLFVIMTFALKTSEHLYETDRYWVDVFSRLKPTEYGLDQNRPWGEVYVRDDYHFHKPGLRRRDPPSTTVYVDSPKGTSGETDWNQFVLDVNHLCMFRPDKSKPFDKCDQLVSTCKEGRALEACKHPIVQSTIDAYNKLLSPPQKDWEQFVLEANHQCMFRADKTKPHDKCDQLVATCRDKAYLEACRHPIVKSTIDDYGKLGSPPPSENVIRYGDTVHLRASSTRYPGYLSPCGQAKDGYCGIAVTLRPDKSYNAWEPNSKLRDWVILGKSSGQPVLYGDKVQIKATAVKHRGHDGFISPCGSYDPFCGVSVTLRPDDQFHRHEPNSNLRHWEITGGKAPGAEVQSGDRVKFRVDAHRWGGHAGHLALCGDRAECGISVAIRPDGSKDPFESSDTLRTWEIIKGPFKN